MAISLVSNSLSLSLHKNFSRSQSDTSVALQRLSSGLRINSAKDDTAGLSISNRMTTQIQGMNQAVRNTNDAISMLQVAEAGMSGVTELLQRGRELTVEAANATMSMVDKQSIQKEIEQILTQVNHIGSTLTFNNINIFSRTQQRVIEVEPEPVEEVEPEPVEEVEPEQTVTIIDNTTRAVTDKDKILNGLQKSWLQQSEQLITTYYGIQANNTDLEIILEDTIPGGATAFVQAGFDGGNNLTSLSLHIDVSELLAANLGTSWPDDTVDQLIAHEMTHAVMDATMNVTSFPTWFMEGTAEFLPGGDHRLKYVLDNGTSEAGVVSNIDSIIANPWTASHLEYATAYLATRYLHDVIGNTGIKELMEYLAADNTRTLDTYFTSAVPQVEGVNIDNTDDFINAFKGVDASGSGSKNYSVITNNGLYFLSNTMDLTNNGFSNTAGDNGAIGGGDATNGGTRDTSWAGTIPDIDLPTNNPLLGFNETWPDFFASDSPLFLSSSKFLISKGLLNSTSQLSYETTQDFKFQVGADTGMNVSTNFMVLDIENLGLSNIDVTEDTDTALLQFDVALNAINQARGKLGATMSRMDSVVNTLHVTSNNMSASRSHILDADFAAEMTGLIKNQILQQAGMAMMAQANSSSSVVLGLL